MKETIYEIVLTILTLTIAITGIHFYRSSMDLVGNMATVSSEIDKAESSTLIDNSVLKDSVNGSDVVAATRYYLSSGISIKVIVGGEEVTYPKSGNAYQTGDFTLSDLEFYKKQFHVTQEGSGIAYDDF